MKKRAFRNKLTRSKEHPATAGDTSLATLNVVNGGPEIAFALLQKSGLAILDGIHNLSDITYLRQLTAIKRHARGEHPTHRQVSKEERHRHRKNTYRLMSWSSLGAAAVAGFGALQSIEGKEDTADFGILGYGHVGTTLASVALAGSLTWAGHRIKKVAEAQSDNLELQKDANDFYTHAKLDLGSSSAALLGAGVHATGHSLIDQTAGAAFAVYQTVRFWPSERNLQRGLEHNHSGCHGH